ncbi:R-spondin-3-like [Cynoglossus semilaevis]|uniref:R-spondin-3-like n=1 Tax=Cynoglossus semilaevis TaxID=244447 RepID=UPI0007DCA360|nr:R-spondin-3-like [Cynoglossus semilaevis]
MWTLSFIWFLQLNFLSLGLYNTRILQHRRNPSVSRECPTGCASCSALNGCLSCRPRFFLHLELDGIRERGTCLSTCPRGYYGNRSPHINKCKRCKEECAFCFSENFCTRCHAGTFLIRGKCESSCPNGLTANAVLRECTDCPTGCRACVRRNMCVRCREGLYILHGKCHTSCPNGTEPDVQLLQCIPKINCKVGEWTEWGPCLQKVNTEGYKKGEESRTRQVLQSSGPDGHPCPHVIEVRKCAIKDTESLINEFLKLQRQ